MIDKDSLRLGLRVLTAGGLLTAAAVSAMMATGAGWIPAGLTVALAGAWACLAMVAARRYSSLMQQRWQAVDAEVTELTARTKTLVDYLAGEFTKQFEAVVTENKQMQGLLADAIERLVGSFTGLEAQTRRQQQLAFELTGGDRSPGTTQGDDGLSIESYLGDIETMLRSFIVAATRNSETGLTLTEQMQKMSDRFHGIQALLKEVKKIADQTNLLAINAAVEAARAGKAGEGFAVVAREVRSLSVHSNTFSGRIGDSMSGVTDVLSSVENAIHGMAAENRELVTAARERVDSLLAHTRSLNRRVEQSAGEISGISEQVSLEVRAAVTSLQFQDMAHQILDHVNGRIAALEGVLTGLSDLSLRHDAVADDLYAACDQRLNLFKEWLDQAASLIENIRHNPVSQRSMAEGEIELF